VPTELSVELTAAKSAQPKSHGGIGGNEPGTDPARRLPNGEEPGANRNGGIGARE